MPCQAEGKSYFKAVAKKKTHSDSEGLNGTSIFYFFLSLLSAGCWKSLALTVFVIPYPSGPSV